MDEYRELIEKAESLRLAYMDSSNGLAFEEFCRRKFGLDLATAQLLWEVIDVVGDQGVE